MQASISDVSTDNFEQEVIESSYQQPVVVDFWAAWCGPCRMLGPVLERLATEANGSWKLVKVDVDKNPSLAARYGVQGIPAVKGLRDGRVAAEFVGVQPEAQIKRFLAKITPSEADQAVAIARSLRSAGDIAAAEQALRTVLVGQPAHPAALLLLGELLAERGEAEEAERLLADLPPRSAEARQAAPLLARLRLSAGEAASLDEARQTLAHDPRNLEANLLLGQALAAQGEYAQALEHLLTVVARDKSYKDGLARTAMLTIFEVLGPDDPLTLEYRRKLSSALY